MRVKPKLYLALGVSGAPEHVEGMRDAELIVAVNQDPDAAIFSIAHYGAVADLFEVAEELEKLLDVAARRERVRSADAHVLYGLPTANPPRPTRSSVASVGPPLVSDHPWSS